MIGPGRSQHLSKSLVKNDRCPKIAFDKYEVKVKSRNIELVRNNVYIVLMQIYNKSEQSIAHKLKLLNNGVET